MKVLWKRWDAYWFRRTPLVDLAVCRIIIVGCQVALLLGRDYHSRFVQLAALPNAFYEPLPILQLMFLPFGTRMYRPSLPIFEVVFWITVAVGVLGLIGLKTRPSLLLFALGNAFLSAANYSFGKKIDHNDALMVIALGILTLSQAGAVLSVDAWRRRSSAGAKAGRHDPTSLLETQSPFARWPLLLIRWLFAFIYASAAINKLTASGLDWMNGYSLQHSLVHDALRSGRPLGLWIGQHHALARLLSWVTIFFEGTFFLTLLVPRLAWIYLPLGVLLHVGIYVTMGPAFFEFIVIYAVFIPWAECFKILSRRHGLLQRGGPLLAPSGGFAVSEKPT